jgi:hypothetical protein
MKSAHSPATAALCGWAALTAVCLGTTAWLLSRGGLQSAGLILQVGPRSNLHLTVLSVALAWVLLGLTLTVVAAGWMNARNTVTFVCFVAFALLYVNVMRERTLYGDVGDYLEAAASLRAGQPLPERYIYPPLLATLLEPLVPLGARLMFEICWLLNLLSLFVWYFLFQRTLERYGFSRTFAAIVVFLFGVVNVPILRTLAYVQVNVHVLNLILVSLLAYPRWRFLSALALAVAVHLKISPLVLAFPFLISRDVRWLAYLAVSLVVVGLVPLAAHGVSPYYDFLHNVQGIQTINPLSFRENSIDSFIKATASVFGFISMGSYGRVLVIVLKLVLLAGGLTLAIGCIRRKTFFEGNDHASAVLNATPVLLVLMVLLSPLVWEHHAVFLGLSYLLLLKKLSTPVEWTVFGIAYFAEFLVPTIDLYPWSYARLLSPLVWLFLVWRSSAQTGPWFAFANAESERIARAQTLVPST